MLNKVEVSSDDRRQQSTSMSIKYWQNKSFANLKSIMVIWGLFYLYKHHMKQGIKGLALESIQVPVVEKGGKMIKSIS